MITIRLLIANFISLFIEDINTRKIVIILFVLYLLNLSRLEFSWLVFSLHLLFLFLFALMKLLEKGFIIISHFSFNKYKLKFRGQTMFLMFWALAFSLLLRYFVFEIILIQSNSMLPTLRSGERGLLDKITMGIKVPPLRHCHDLLLKKSIFCQIDSGISRRISWLRLRKIKRKDVIVFRAPYGHGRGSYIKRVIALPGDSVKLNKQGEIKINNTTISEPYLRDKRITSMYNNSPENFEVPEFFKAKGKVASHAYLFGSGYNFKVPSGMYFVLGDNREHSQDSRKWGFVPIEYIIGRVLFNF